MSDRPTNTGRSIANFFKMSVQEYLGENGSQKAAALAFYTAFSVAPLLVIAVAVAGFIFGEQAASGELAAQIEETLGAEAAATIEQMIATAANFSAGIIATIIGIGALLWGASQVFVSLQTSLDQIWDVEPDESGWRGSVRDKLRSFAMVLAMGLFLIGLLLVSTAVSTVAAVAGDLLPAEPIVWQTLNNVLSLALLSGAFAALFRFLPRVNPAWRDVWVGAAMTAALFVIGRWAVGLYLSNAAMASVLGAAGAFAVFLLWVFYMAQIVLLGAVMTRVYAREYGHTGRRQKPDQQDQTLESRSDLELPAT
ncbi:MAG: YihY/virulence factor BrkB family protein [Bradymonadaceae bacterium]|nr:YihY/virulence factor BrkB family protein [Lujinxingiaceae bacterium]